MRLLLAGGVESNEAPIDAVGLETELDRVVIRALKNRQLGARSVDVQMTGGMVVPIPTFPVPDFILRGNVDAVTSLMENPVLLAQISHA